MALKYIDRPPKFAPGAGVAKALMHGLYMAESDSFAIGDSLPVAGFHVPANVFVYDLIIDIETAFVDSGSGGVLVMAGYSGDSDAFFNDSAISAIGTHKMSGGVKKGGYLSTGTDIEVSWATTCSVGGGKAYLVFMPYGDENYLEMP